MVKLMLVMMMVLIVFKIFEVHANYDPTPLTYAPTLPPTGLHPFKLDNENMTHIIPCLESTIEEPNAS